MTPRPTCEDVARAAGAALNIDVAIILQEQWVTERYAFLAARTPLRALHREAAVTIPAALTTGTLAITLGSRAVTGDAAAVAAWGAEPLVGRYLGVGNAWYAIAAAEGAVLQLASPVVDPTAAAATYQIVARTVALAEDARTLGAFHHPQRRRTLVRVSRADLDQAAPTRRYLAFGPTVVADFGVDGAGRRLVEFYPYQTTPQQIRYDYWAAPPRLQLDDPIPAPCDLHQLKEGVLIDCMRFLAAKAAQAGDYPGAAFWRNEARAQETRWETLLDQAILNDRGLDDVETRLRSTRWGGVGFEIRTAFDEIAARGR